MNTINDIVRSAIDPDKYAVMPHRLIPNRNVIPRLGLLCLRIAVAFVTSGKICTAMPPFRCIRQCQADGLLKTACDHAQHRDATLEMQCKHNQIHTYTFTNMNPAASGTMSMSYLKRHVYELRTSMDPNIVVKLQSLDHDMARIWVENAEGVCVDTHEVSVHEATGEELTITNEAVRVERSYIIKINKSYVVLFMGSRILKIHKQQQHALFTANGADLKRI